MKHNGHFIFQTIVDGCSTVNWGKGTIRIFYSGYFSYRGAFGTILDLYSCVTGLK